MRAESQVVLRWIAQQFAFFGSALGIGFPVIAMLDHRSGDLPGVFIGLALLILAYVSFRLYRPGVCTKADALKLMSQLGFDISIDPLSNGTVQATLNFIGAGSALWGGYAALGSTRYVTLKAPLAGASFGPATVRKCSSQTSLLALRPQRYDLKSVDPGVTAKLQAVVKQLDYLDVNIAATDTTLSVDVYGSFFQGQDLRRNISNALQLLGLMMSQQQPE